jgi:hypothetical protein
MRLSWEEILDEVVQRSACREIEPTKSRAATVFDRAPLQRLGRRGSRRSAVSALVRNVGDEVTARFEPT